MDSRGQVGGGDVLSLGAHAPDAILGPTSRRDPQGGLSEQDVWERIEQARERWNVLEHPFYQRWSAGELTREELADYSGPVPPRDRGDRPPQRRRRRLRARPERAELAATPRRRPRTSPSGTASSRPSAARSAPAPTAETAECVDAWTASDDRLSQLARLYAIESGQPAISRTKREGLAAHYGIGDGPGTAYFRVHEDGRRRARRRGALS